MYADTVLSLEARGVPHRSVVVGSGPALAGLQAMLPRTVFLGSLQARPTTHHNLYKPLGLSQPLITTATTV